jgi:predicted peptidase
MFELMLYNLRKMKEKKIGIILLFFAVYSIQNAYSQTLEKNSYDQIKYLLYKPDGYNADSVTKWPLIVFLHGGGERGDNLNKVSSTGPIKYTLTGKKLPFLIFSPQIKSDQFWDPKEVIKLMNEIIKDYRVDTNRIYLTGLSIGGKATWEVSTEYPDKFAAIAPVSGWGDPKQLWKISKMAVWIFHGQRDPVVPVIASKVMADTLKKYGNVKLTIYPKGMHGHWTDTYNNDELYKWFLVHKRN